MPVECLTNEKQLTLLQGEFLAIAVLQHLLAINLALLSTYLFKVH